METLAGFGQTQGALLRLLLHHKKGLTVDGIAQGLCVTRTAVNQHLFSLERDGYVRRVEDSVATGGRPSRLYALTDAGIHLFPKNYDLFSIKALETMWEVLGPEKTNKTLERLGRSLGADLGERVKDLPLRKKTPAIVNALLELGFDAKEDEASTKTNPSITAYNCVYHSLARTNAEICRLDLAFLREASGANVDHVACMAKGDNECRFKFSAKKKKPKD